MRKLLGAALSIVLLAGCGAVKGAGRDAPQPPATAALPWKTTAVSEGDLRACAGMVATWSDFQTEHLHSLITPLSTFTPKDYATLADAVGTAAAKIKTSLATVHDAALRTDWQAVTTSGTRAAHTIRLGQQMSTLDALTPMVQNGTIGVDACNSLTG